MKHIKSESPHRKQTFAEEITVEQMSSFLPDIKEKKQKGSVFSHKQWNDSIS